MTAPKHERTSGKSPVVVYLAAGANIAIAVLKFIVAAVTASSALLSEAIHSTVDTGNELLLLLGLHRARRPADEAHPYGYGKEVYFWSLVVAMVLFAAGGVLSMYEGYLHLRHPEPVQKLPWSLLVLGGSFVFEGVSFVVAYRELRRRHPDRSIWHIVRASKDPSVFTVLGEDATALAGLLVATAGVVLAHVLHEPRFDGAASVVIGSMLCTAAWFLARETHDLLLGERASHAVIEGVRRVAAGTRGVRAVRSVVTMQLAPDQVLLNLEAEFEPELSSEELAAVIERLDAAVRRAHPEVVRIFIEAQAIGRSERDAGRRAPPAPLPT